jgi:hypothetical protein
VQTPAWSPDGHRIAFSGMAGGLSDLYVLDLASGTVRQLTDDRYAHLHPAWSPDGGTLAFVTDRGHGHGAAGVRRDADRPAGRGHGAVRMLDLFPSGKHINPQFSPDGQDLYFIADPHGFSDCTGWSWRRASSTRSRTWRRASAGSRSCRRPCRCARRRWPHDVLGVRELGQQHLRPGPGCGAGSAGGPDHARRSRARPCCRPWRRSAAAWSRVPGGPADGPADQRQFAIRPYDSRLGLDYIGPPTVGVGVSEFGGAAYRRRHRPSFSATCWATSRCGRWCRRTAAFKDIGGQAHVHERLEHRWNWGGVAATSRTCRASRAGSGAGQATRSC